MLGPTQIPGGPTSFRFQFEKELFTTTLWVQPVSQIPTHHTDHMSGS